MCSTLLCVALVLSELKLDAFRDAKAAVADGGFAQRYFEELDKSERSAWHLVNRGPQLVRQSSPSDKYVDMRKEIERALHK